MPIRIAALNLSHATRPKAIPDGLTAALLGLEPDVVVLTEYVDGGGRYSFKRALKDGGLGYVQVSRAKSYTPGTYYNQVLIASRQRSVPMESPSYGPYPGLETNRLTVSLPDLTVTGFRMPGGATKTGAADRDAAWRWSAGNIAGDVLIGDLNINPAKSGVAHRRAFEALRQEGWHWAPPVGEWSFRRGKATRTSIDHVLVRGPFKVLAARYEAKPFAFSYSDHAALVVDIVRAL
jgi:hypothetical protein